MSRSRPARLAALVVAGVTALTCTFAAGVAFGADPALEEADGALEKGAALLESAQAGVGDPEVVERFDRKRDRAVVYVERARQQIEALQELVDGG